MPRSLLWSAVPVFAITAVVWGHALTEHTFLAKEVPQYVAIFTLPGALPCAACWLLSAGPWWRRGLGVVVLLPGLAVWILSLVLVWHGFTIH